MRDKALAAIVVAACSSPRASEPDAPVSDTPPAMVETGALVGGTGPWPGYIAGIHYRSRAQAGVTDAQGTFRYEAGEPVTFELAGVTLRATPGAPMLSPYQLAGQGTCEDNSDLDHLLVLLDSLDADHDPTNGISVIDAEGAPTTLDQLEDAGVQALVEELAPGHEPVDVAVAIDAFIRQIDAEIWQDVGKDTFTGTTAGVRSQGCATDGTAWYFSWRYGLERDDAAFTTQTSSLYAIPPSIAATGSDHIGDLDVLGSTVYAAIEDSKSYAAPKIVLYDATTLGAGTIYSLSNTLLTKGVPWVAVDGPRGQLYVAQWDPTPAILVHDLATVTFQRALPLTPALGRIQGAKVFEGMLYASEDDANKTIYKINLETGTAMPLFGIAGSGIEEEGLCFAPRADGSMMHTMADIASSLSMELHHHTRTRDPLRKMVCP